jgi:hypothetical protein
MSIAQNLPNLKPSLSLDFASVKKLDPRISFSRPTVGSYYDGKSVAKAEENLVLRSEEFDNAYWVKDNATVTANATTAPDGTTTAESINEGTSASAHAVYATPPAPEINKDHVFSVFVKDVDAQYVVLQFRRAGSDYWWASYDLTNETSTVIAQASGASIVSVGDGWYRLSLSFNIGSVATAPRLSISLWDGVSSTATNNGYSYTGTNRSIFLWGAQLEQRSSVTAYTVTTTQPITNYIPTLLSAPANVARFDHNPVTGESLGLLVEEQRTNLLTRSEDFENAAWVGGNVSRINNTVVAPNGTLTGGKIFHNDGVSATTGSVINLLNISAAAGTYTYSIYGKQGEFNRIWMRVRGEVSAGNSFSVAFNLTDGTIQTAAANAGTFTGATASSVPVGNGWYRFTLTGVTTGETALRVQVTGLSSTISVGDGYSGIYIWGAQLEAGAFPTSYIKTEASQVTRSSDSASMTGANFSSWYSQGAGTFYVDGNLPNPSSSGNLIRRLIEISDGTDSNRIFFGHGSTQNLLRAFYLVNGVSQNGGNGQTANSVFPSAKVALALKLDDYAFSPNGATVTADTSALVPVLNQLNIGTDRSFSALSSANGHIRKLAFYPKRLTDTQLAALTS